MSASLASFYGGPAPSSLDAKRQRLRLHRRLEKAEREAGQIIYLSSGAAKVKRLDDLYPEYYAVYATQSAAIEATEEESSDLLAFCAEVDASGKRSFICCHPEKMFSVVTSLRPERRHFYEVVRAGRPCKLYLDVEHCRTSNTGKVGDAEEKDLQDFLDHLCSRIEQVFGAPCTSADYLQLDSSTEQKFSRHVIFQRPVFADNSAVGRFIRDDVMNSLPPDLASRLAEYRDREGRPGCGIVDLGVYTRNRNFRLMFCSKFGKRATLEIGRRNDDRFRRLGARDLFLASLVSVLGSADNAVHFGSPAERKTKLISGLRNGTSKDCDYRGTPFTEIDDFIAGLVEPGYIRKASWDAEEGSVRYEIAGAFKYCENVGRHHRSNNIRYVVLLSRGSYFQTCHDPDCLGYSSPERSLPSSAMPWLQMARDDEEEEENRFLLQASETF